MLSFPDEITNVATHFLHNWAEYYALNTKICLITYNCLSSMPENVVHFQNITWTTPISISYNILRCFKDWILSPYLCLATLLQKKVFLMEIQFFKTFIFSGINVHIYNISPTFIYSFFFSNIVASNFVISNIVLINKVDFFFNY